MLKRDVIILASTALGAAATGKLSQHYINHIDMSKLGHKAEHIAKECLVDICLALGGIFTGIISGEIYG